MFQSFIQTFFLYVCFIPVAMIPYTRMRSLTSLNIQLQSRSYITQTKAALQKYQMMQASGSQPFLMHFSLISSWNFLFLPYYTFFLHSSPITRVCRNIWSTNILFLIWLLPVAVWLIVRVRGLVLTAIGTMDFIEDNNLINKSGTKLFVK